MMKKTGYRLLSCLLACTAMFGAAYAQNQPPAPPGSTLQYYCQSGNGFLKKRFSNEPLITQAGIPDSITIVKDVPYRSAVPWDRTTDSVYKMDLYYPDTTFDPLKKRPCILLMYGGAFTEGNKKQMKNYCLEFATRGYVAVAINYRLGKALDPACTNFQGPGDIYSDEKAQYRAVQDADSAMRFLVSKANKYGIDTAWMFVGGFSAGAGICNGLVYADQAEIEAAVPGIGSLLGPLKGTTNPYTIKGVFNNWGGIGRSMYSRDQAVPMVAFHGMVDSVVPVGNDIRYNTFVPECGLNGPIMGSAGLADSMQHTTVCFDVTLFRGAGHGIWANNASDALKDANLTFRVERATCFFKKIMCGVPCGQTLQYVAKADRDDPYAWPRADCSPFTQQLLPSSALLSETEQPVAIYPNPAQDDFRIGGLRLTDRATVRLYDQTGRLLKTYYAVNAATSLSAAQLTRGIYLVKVETATGAAVTNLKLMIR